MIEAKAIGYEGKISQASGASEPVIVAVQAQIGNEIFDVYAKLTDKLPLGLKCYSAEAIASLLASDLKISTPPACAVLLEDDFIASVHDEAVRARMLTSERLVFATRKLPASYKVVPRELPLDDVLLQKAADIFAFDMLIENPDRGGPGKPNCLISGQDLAIIDHEKAFPHSLGLPILGRKNGWEVGAFEHYKNQNSHLFVNQLLKKCANVELIGFQKRWDNVTDERIKEYGAMLPPSWVSDFSCTQKILQHITSVRDNIIGCITEIDRILGKAS
jgi:hypothetical protein